VPAAPKRARKVRKAEEFDIRALVAKLHASRVSRGAYAWSLADIQSARDEQMRGVFARAARLAEAFNTDDAGFTAKRNRVAPTRVVPTTLIAPNDSGRAKRILEEAGGLFGPDGVGITTETRASVARIRADHGVAFTVNTWTPREDGSRVDLEAHVWPIDAVRWDPERETFVTRVDMARTDALPLERLEDGAYGLQRITFGFGGEIPITHGDGRWTVWACEESEPWKFGCVLPGALTWARRAFGLRDWARGSASHGNAKVVGEMPEGIAIDSAEGAAFLDLLIAIGHDDSPVGIKPHGATVDYLTNSSAQWQIFRELATHGEVSFSRIYLGQDGMLGTNGAGPGIDLTALAAVTDDIVKADLRSDEVAITTGMVQVWAAQNFGDSKDAPRFSCLVPDVDQDARREGMAKRRTAFYDALRAEHELLFDVTPERVAALAAEYDVTAPTIRSSAHAPAPALPAAPSGSSAPAALPASP
jgi:hypothetical protein